MEPQRTKSILRNGAAGQQDRKTSVHYPRDSKIFSIVPPLGTRASRFREEISSSSSQGAAGADGSAHGAAGADGSAHGVAGADRSAHGAAGADGSAHGVAGADRSAHGVAGADGSAHGVAGADGSAHGAGAGGGNVSGSGKGRVGSLRDEAPFDVENLSEDLTPLSEVLQNRLDFSVVFGPVQAKYNENEDFSDEPEFPKRGQKQTNEQKRKARGPEQKMTVFAFRLALIEKAASGLGTIAFVWATVVILGGFASTIGVTDFWVVTVIILAETSRIFSRSHQLEWQHLSSKSTGALRLGRIFSLWTRSFSGQSNGTDPKQGRSSRHSSRLRRAMSAPISNQSPESELRTPTNSSSVSSRHNRGQSASVLPVSGPAILQPPRRPSDPQRRPWSYLAIPLIPFGSGVLTTELVSRVLYFAQIGSATLCIGLSIWRLADQNFYSGPRGGFPNVDVSMNVFYVLAVLEAALFLLEMAYREYRYKRILDRVCNEDHVGFENSELVTQFFYDVYDGSLKGSVFDGLDMNLVQYSIKWLQTEGFKQQLGGARLLNRFVSKNDKFRMKDRVASDTLRRLGTTPGIIERLVEMLSWGSRHEEELLNEVSSIICRLVVYNRNCARFVAVPGAMDGVVSLLFPYGTNSSAPHIRSTNSTTSPHFLRLMGLRILKYLCKDHKNSLKIGETRGLLSILMVFIEVTGESSFQTHRDVDDKALECRLKTYKKTLQVLLLLASATNTSGAALRTRIGKIVSGLKNLRDMIEFGSDNPELQRLAIEVIYHLAMEDDVRKMIGATGGLIRNLFRLFRGWTKFVEEEVSTGSNEDHQGAKKMIEEKKLAAVKAGETLTRLVLQNDKNCKRLLGLKDEKTKEKVLVQVMVAALSTPEDKIASSAASILRSVLKYADEESKREIATKTATIVVKQMLRKGASTKSEMYEASLGLASRIVEPLDTVMYREILATVNKGEFVQQLMRNLQHTPATNKYPRIRRFSVELIIAFIEKDDTFLNAFKRHKLDIKGVLEKTSDSISEVENFCLFSGLVGYTRHYEEIEDLVERAIAKVDRYHLRSTSSEEITQ